MDLSDYVGILRRRWLVVVTMLVLGVLLALGATLAATPVYQAETQLFVSTPSTSESDGNALNAGEQFAQARVRSYADIVGSQSVTEPVIQRLGLDLSTRDLARAITATAPVDTVLLNIEVKDNDAEQAQAIADAVAQQFVIVAADLESSALAGGSQVKVSIVREAELPLSPISPNPAINLALGMLVGLGLGVALAVVRDRLDTRMGSSDRLHTVTGLPVLGTIDAHSAAEPGRLPMTVQGLGPRRAQDFRRLHTSLEVLGASGRPRTLLVTSAEQGEGKTTTAAHLAVTSAEAGVSTVLLETNLRRPALASVLGLAPSPGLTDVLNGEATVDEALLDVGSSGLRVIVAGSPVSDPSQLLGSEGMHQLLKNLPDLCDLVLVDAAATLAYADAAVLAPWTSGVVLVVRSGTTRQEQVEQAVELLERVDATIYGTVLSTLPRTGRRRSRRASSP